MDYCIQEYGSVLGLPMLLFDNPEMEADSTLDTGDTLTFRVLPEGVQLNPATRTQVKRTNIEARYTERAEEGQSMVDFCIQEYGDVRALAMLLFDNPALNFATAIQTGQALVFRRQIPIGIETDTEVRDLFQNRRIQVNTRVPQQKPPLYWGEDGQYWGEQGEYWQL